MRFEACSPAQVLTLEELTQFVVFKIAFSPLALGK
jgi:hypothetical protein